MADNLNLSPERGPNVWDKPAGHGRWKAQAGGAAMLAGGVAAAFVGGRMLYNALRGNRKIGNAGDEDAADMVGMASDQSFPASDAPSWTPAKARPRR